MTTKQDYLTHKSAFLLSLEARLFTLKIGSSRRIELRNLISQEYKTFDAVARGKIINKMNQLKNENPGFNWERDWTKVQGV